MRRRQQMREQKQETKTLIKNRRLAGDTLNQQQSDILTAINEEKVVEKKEEVKVVELSKQELDIVEGGEKDNVPEPAAK